MKFLEPWHEAHDASLVAELSRELARGHVLFGIPVKVLARRHDRDDVLFELADGSSRLAQVHLTFQVESSSAWPSARLFPDWDAWLESMRRDHDEFCS